MNQISLKGRTGNPSLEVFVDDKSLADYFISSDGTRYDEVFVLGWLSAPSDINQETLLELFGKKKSALASGRTALLVCKECGAIAARIERNENSITWSDWAYENGYEPSEALAESAQMKLFQFDIQDYETAFLNKPNG